MRHMNDLLGIHLQLVSVTLSTSRRRQWYAIDVQFNLWEGFIAMDELLVQGEYSDCARWGLARQTRRATVRFSESL